MANSKEKVVVTEQTNDEEKLVTVSDFISILSKLDQNTVILFKYNADWDLEDYATTLSKLKESLYISKKEYLFSKDTSANHNYLVINIANF